VTENPAPATPAKPERLGAYELLLELAAGGMATVHLAKAIDKRQGPPLVAVKRPHRHLQGDKTFLTMLVDEARLASAIDHPNVVKVRELGFDGGMPFIVMDYIEGTSLAELRRELSAILEGLPPAPPGADAAARVAWERWQDGLTIKPTLLSELPPLRMLLVLDNLAGHKTAAFVCWLFIHGIMPLYTPLSGSWLNMAESIQRILKRRALGGQHPQDPGQIIGWFEAVARHWNADPTPFVWGGKRMERRRRQRERCHRVGGSGACTRGPIRRRSKTAYGHGRGK